MKNILMVGLHDGYMRYFERHPELRLHVLEEPDIHASNPQSYRHCPTERLVLAEYQQSDDFRDAVLPWHQRIGFDAIVPAFEYGVEAAGNLASTLGLRFPGHKAISACTDKLVLRRLLRDTPVMQPRWRQVASEPDVRDFFWDAPVVIKPTNRHASVGVVRVDRADDIPQRWQDCVGADEVRTIADRERQGAFIAEEFVAGYQVSVETLSRDGDVIFTTVDLMLTAEGPYFPILSVTVPAPIPAEEYSAAVRAAQDLARALDVEYGTIHSEWKIHAGQPYLIECAARVPGAFTAECAERSYNGFSMYGAQIALLAGLDVPLPGPATSTATARWFHPPAGKLLAIQGADSLESDPAVFLHRIKVAPGGVIPECRDGWHRIGYFAVEAPTPEQASAKVSELLTAVRFDVAPQFREIPH